MKRARLRPVPALACLLVFAAPAAFAQHAGHDMSRMPGMSADEHARMLQEAEAPSPTLPPPTSEERARAFPDLGGMDMREHMDDDPFVAMIAFDRLEAFRGDDARGFAWELQGWAGHRRDRLEWRSRGERVAGETQDGELELLWSHATGPWWSRTLGVRHDTGDGESRDWVALGVDGTAPYRIDLAATVYAGEHGGGVRIEGSYDLLLAQRLVLQPRVEADAYTGNDAPRDTFAAGLRLRYEVTRQFAPYFGYEWSPGGKDSGARWVAGIRGWF